ncbi:Nicotinate-nucleotide--dimethylbenzimidazole phosphoribosyltransferase [groundwater metagenome]|uniref:Nicotinate-nucleotide--dimethylbenzimidazole phosphoribosyltransferase n=1 Tax=groundwater metagenome TaxID=717931 RepID=A0A098EAD1_9ZZZZ
MSREDTLNDTLNAIEPIDKNYIIKAQKMSDNLTKPLGSLGRLEELASLVCGIKRTLKPKIENKVIFTLAADHGVAEEGVSAFPQEVTKEMISNFVNGGAGVNVLARHVNAKVIVIDMGVKGEILTDGVVIKKVAHGTKNFTKGRAMTREQAIGSVIYGIELVDEEMKKEALDIVGTGDMGIANTTPSSAVVAAITKVDVEKITGKGTGITDEIFNKKIEVIKKGLNLNKPNPDDAIDVLSKVGGFEIGGIAGVIIGCAKNKIPVVIDGFISGAGALLAYKLNPLTKDYMLASHQSVEQGHKILLEHIGLKPLLNLNLRLGEGTGSALAINLVEASCKILNEMATFEEAEISNKIR